MTLYIYKARDKSGELDSGTIEAASEEAAFKSLDNRGLILSSLSKKDQQFDLNKLTKGSTRVTVSMLMVFTKQFATMVNAGMSITESLKTLGEEENNFSFSEVIKDLDFQVEGGSNLSGAMSKYPKIFSEIYIGLIKVGEASGKLDETLEKISNQLEKEYTLKNQIRSALIYPAFILTTMVAVSILIVTFVIPKLKPMLEGAGVQLPFLTKVMIFTSEAFLGFWWIIIPAIIGLIIFLTSYVHTTKGGKAWAGIKIKLPIVGKIVRSIYMARFSRTFSTLIAGGVNIVEALEISGDSIGNTLYNDEIKRISKEVKNGVSLAESFKKSDLISQIVKKMVRVGESTGTLDVTINKVAIFYEEEVQNSVDNLTKTLEPLLIVIMGIGVAAVVSSVIMPLYDATRAMGK
ncbi:type II secretion system F family protein [bacterium]|nr:type II secretion system F family protein [bacterium]